MLGREKWANHTLLFPATSVPPSDAMLTLRIGTSSAGTCCTGYYISLDPIRNDCTTYEFMSTAVLPKIPNLHASILVTRYQFALIRMDHDIVDRRAVIVVALYAGRPRTAASAQVFTEE